MDQTEERLVLLRDMNGNALRQGDLVMVLLEKPVLVGFISEIAEPSILTARDKNPPGVITITGTIKLPFAPNVIQILRQTAKLVDPRSEALVNALTQHVNASHADVELPTKKEAEPKPGPSLVPSSAAPTVEEVPKV
jgi:hypothetical protein